MTAAFTRVFGDNMATIEDRLKGMPLRQVILAACAFARTVEHLLTDERSRDAIDVAEWFADGLATIEEVGATVQPAWAAVAERTRALKEVWRGPETFEALWRVEIATTSEARAAAKAAAKAKAAENQGGTMAFDAVMAAEAAWGTVSIADRAARAAVTEAAAWAGAETAETVAVKAGVALSNQSILDCILPARMPVPTSVSVNGLATKIYEDREWSLMPILADALEDAGCDNAVVLNHCRHLVGHARGCWVLDSVLGKR